MEYYILHNYEKKNGNKESAGFFSAIDKEHKNAVMVCLIEQGAFRFPSKEEAQQFCDILNECGNSYELEYRDGNMTKVNDEIEFALKEAGIKNPEFDVVAISQEEYIVILEGKEYGIYNMNSHKFK